MKSLEGIESANSRSKPDDALFKSAKIYDDLLSDDALALQLYNKILEDYNSSIFVAESRRRIRELTK